MPHSDEPYDPTFLNARKEAWIILAAWLASLIWTVGYAAIAGYDQPADSIALLFGMPAWIVWGILTPWLAATVFSVIFSLFFMKDDVL